MFGTYAHDNCGPLWQKVSPNHAS